MAIKALPPKRKSSKIKPLAADKKRRKHFWDERYILEAYKLALSGIGKYAVGKALGIPKGVWEHWLKIHPALYEAVRTASQSAIGERSSDLNTDGERYIDYVYRRVPHHLKPLWDKIVKINGGIDDGFNEKPIKEQPNAAEKIERLFTGRGDKRARQCLFLHAYIVTHFNANAACRMLNLNRKILDQWDTEPGFHELREKYIKETMKDFADSAYWRHVAAGTESIVKHVQETLNADRGYARKRQSDDADDGKPKGLNIQVILNNLPVNQRREMLDSLRRAAPNPLSLSPVEAPVVSVIGNGHAQTNSPARDDPDADDAD